MLESVRRSLNAVGPIRWLLETTGAVAGWIADRKYAKRILVWAVVGLLSATVIMLRDISALLGSISGGDTTYDAGILTRPKLFFWDTTEFKDALRTWAAADSPDFNVRRLVATHAALDAFAFIPAYSLLLGVWLRHVGAKFAFSVLLASTLFFVDEIETVTTWIEVADLTTDHSFMLGLIKFFSLAKWVVLGTILASIAALWFKPTPEVEGSSDFRDNVAGIREKAKAGRDQEPGVAVSGLVVLVGALFALVALPAGGPLEQLPDVIRNHLAEGDLWLWAMSTAGLVLFAVAVFAAGLMSTTREPESAATPGSGTPARVPDEPQRRHIITSLQMIIGSGIVSLLLLVLSCWADGEPNPAALAPALVVIGLSLATWLASRARGLDETRQPPQKNARDAARRVRWDEQAVVWAGGLAAAIISISGLGLIRGAFVPYLLRIENDVYPWSLALAFGCSGALTGGVFQWILSTRFRNWGLRRARICLGVVAVVVVGCAVWLMLSPPSGELWGSTGVIGVGFAFWALVVGSLAWTSRRRRAWWDLHKIGIGQRTPWATLLVVTWILASVLNTRGGYHDARVEDDFGPTPATYSSLETAFHKWKSAQTGECSPDGLKRIPLVLVAAPGGGIRAAYWTAASLDRIFPGGCPRLFAISGVSGGSVGATTWVAAASQGKDGAPAVERMSADVALPSALSAFLFRDLPQPLLGISEGWADRAAMLEDGWIRRAAVFGSVKEPTTWANAVGSGPSSDLGFMPVVTLNGSSVNDGCRVLVSNVADLPTTQGEDCQAAADGEVHPTGPISGSIDAFAGLHERDAADRNCGARDAGMRATTAALLSARFPLISPTGALVRCIDNDTDLTTYSVDGGYYENSGLLTLLETWNAVAGLVREHNQTIANSEAADGPVIEPWFVVVDNHYQNSVRKAPPGRPLETLAILRAYQQEELTQSILEQAAWFETSSFVAQTDSLFPDTIASCPDSPRFVRVAPAVTPDVAAPLGWVLSKASRDNLDKELGVQINENPALRCLVEELQE